MNFFERQDWARRRTALLVAYFAAAVVLIIAAVNGVAWLLLYAQGSGPGHFQDWMLTPTFWKWSGFTACLILAGSLTQYLRLRSGGEAVARMVNARPIELTSTNPDERRLINVVEEMSIAAGIIPPRLYVMDHENSINAFVAGYQPDQAVMVVTRGTLEQLNRDELQGVVGHEFSHILNGDMRLNIRLVSVLAGILLIGQTGEFLLRSTRHLGRSRDSAKAAPFLLVGGVGLAVVGYIGLFFGRLIQSAVSRQREYLADAASVQFTRNPQGLASALYKIRRSVQGSLLTRTLHAEDMNHLCFSESVRLRFQSLFASHPPLEQRIQAIDPSFITRARISQNQEKIQSRMTPSTTPIPPGTSGLVMHEGAAALAMETAEPLTTRPGVSLIEEVGQLQPVHFERAEQLLATWPEKLRTLTHHQDSAMTLIAATLVLDMNPTYQKQAWQLLYLKAEQIGLSPETLEWAQEQLPRLGRASVLPVVELCLGGLQTLDKANRSTFLEFLQELIRLDKRYSLFEFVIFSIVSKQMTDRSEQKPGARFRSYKPVIADISRVLAILARTGTQDREQMTRNFASAIRPFATDSVGFPDRCTITDLSTSLRRLALLDPLLKQPLLQSCADVILHDNQVTVEEYELLRGIAEVLDCPMPPLPLPSHR